MPRPRGDIEPRIIHAARARFLADGVDGASLRRIARDARTNIGMIYYYFPTKEDLFLAVVEAHYARIVADLGVALAPDVPVEARLRRLFERFGRLTEDEAITMRLIVREVMVSSTRRKRILERFLRGHIPFVLGTILEGVQRGTLTDRQPLVTLAIASGALAVFPQLIRNLAAPHVPPELGLPSAEALAGSLVDLLLHGIAKGATDR